VIKGEVGGVRSNIREEEGVGVGRDFPYVTSGLGSARPGFYSVDLL
jgi:hypothetical protein